MFYIHIEPHFLRVALALDPARRRQVEQAKSDEGIDDHFYKTCCELFLNGSTPLERDDKTARQVLSEIESKLDAVLAAICLCENSDDLEALKRLAESLGRRHKPPAKKINTQELLPKLKKVFSTLERAQKDRRKLIRQKLVAAIAIINNALALKRTGNVHELSRV